MALPNSSYVFSNTEELSHDSRSFVDPSPYAPLLGPASPTALPRRRRFRTSKFVLLFLAGLLGVVLSVIYATKNGMDQESKIARPVLSSSTTRTPENVTRGVAQGVSEKTFQRLRKGAPSYPWTEKMLSWQRTAYHFQPKENWMNDPNGPIVYNGWYHLFYQYNPYGAVWGNIVWGHAASKDLIHWRHLPIAMVADKWYDSDGVWTGSATILQDGQLIMLYTGSTNETVQVQNLAYPLDPSDPLLIKWVKYPDNPIMVPPPDIGPQDFRDPTTAWLTHDAKWRFTIGSKVDTTGISLVYETKDFKSFERVNGTLHAVAGTGMWECVDFFPVSKVGETGLNVSVDGPEVKHVMKTSLDDDRNDYYALGTYDSKAGTWTPDDPDKDVGIGLRYDYGIFYASKTFYDHEKNRRVLWGWVKETDSESADIQKGWASLQAIPRTVLFDKKTESNVLLWPIEEVERLRVDKTIFQNVVINPGSVVPLDLSYASDQLDIVAEFEIDEQAVERYSINGTNNTIYNCSTSGGGAERGALGPFGLLILANKVLSEQTPVYFYISKDSKGNLTTFFCADHSRSSEAADTDKEIYGSIVPVFKGEKLSIRILVDHSIVESFWQGGRTCITSRIYPTKAINEDAQVFLFNNATDAHITASLQIWQMSFAPEKANQFRISMLFLSICFAILLL